MVRRFTNGTGALDESVRQEGTGYGIVELADIALGDQALAPQRRPDLAAEPIVFGTIGTAVVIELNIELGKVRLVGSLHIGDEGLFAPAFGPRSDHDRRAVGIVGADENASLAAELLKPHPNIGLDVFNQVPDMDGPIGVGQSSGDQYFACDHAILDG